MLITPHTLGTYKVTLANIKFIMLKFQFSIICLKYMAGMWSANSRFPHDFFMYKDPKAKLLAKQIDYI